MLLTFVENCTVFIVFSRPEYQQISRSLSAGTELHPFLKFRSNLLMILSDSDLLQGRQDWGPWMELKQTDKMNQGTYKPVQR